jgi:hypothetical protein
MLLKYESTWIEEHAQITKLSSGPIGHAKKNVKLLQLMKAKQAQAVCSIHLHGEAAMGE